MKGYDDPILESTTDSFPYSFNLTGIRRDYKLTVNPTHLLKKIQSRIRES